MSNTEIKKLNLGDTVILLEGADDCIHCGLNPGFAREVQAKGLTGIVNERLLSTRYDVNFEGATNGNNEHGGQRVCSRHLSLEKIKLFDTEPFKSMRLQYDGNLFGENNHLTN